MKHEPDCQSMYTYTLQLHANCVTKEGYLDSKGSNVKRLPVEPYKEGIFAFTWANHK